MFMEDNPCFRMQRIASHIIKVHASGAAASKNTDVMESENWLKRLDMEFLSLGTDLLPGLCAKYMPLNLIVQVY